MVFPNNNPARKKTAKLRSANPIDLPRPFLSSGANSRRAFDITPSGKFVGLVEGRAETGVPADSQFQVVLNWFEELKARVPTKQP